LGTATDSRSIAFAKTTRPVVSSIMPRERLFARLDGSPGRTVAWISGPPGAGKTSLAASYAEARRLRTLWYQVDADDADVASFFHYLGRALRKLDPARAKELPAYKPHYAADLAAFSRKYFRQLFARTKSPQALVLDSLHAVPADCPLLAVLEVALSHVPVGWVVIVTSRNEPPPSLARLRVSGEMAHAGGEALRFERGELAGLAGLRAAPLAAEAIEQLHARTQGWAAGIVLMLEHAKLAGRMAELPGDAAPRAVFDYLAGEIFARFEPATQRFLLRVACLSRMTGGVAEALSGVPHAARLLVNLALNDYFVSEALIDEARVYQFHPLLRDFLRSRAAQDLPEALGAAHLRKAAALLNAAGHGEDAVALLVQTRDWPQVARLALEQAPALLAQGRSELLAGWLELLPAEVLESEPALLSALGECRSRTAPRVARRLFERAFDGFRRAKDAAGMATSCRGAMRAAILEFDDLAALDGWIAVMPELLHGRSDPASTAALLGALLLRDPGNPALDAWSDRARRELTEAKPDGEAAAELTLACAAAALARGRFAEGLAQLDALRRSGAQGFASWLRTVAAAVALAEGNLDEARAELQALEAAQDLLRRGDRALVHYLRAWLATLEGDPGLAQREARLACAAASETGIPWFECLARVGLAETLAEGGDWRGCEAQLLGADAIAARVGRPALAFAVRTAVAAAANRRGQAGAALEPLREAFAIGREQGFHHVPAWQARPVADLCVLALREKVEPEFARSLARACKLAPSELPFRITDWPWPLRVRSFGAFQLLRAEGAVEFAGKGPGRPMELLKVLLALGGSAVRAEQVADALWPHVDADYAHNSLTATLHRLRKLLGADDALLLRDGRLTLNPALVWADTWALDQVLGDFDAALRAPQPDADTLRELEAEAFALYRGPFLPDESEQASYIACREQVRAKLLRCLTRVARRHEEAGGREAAADCYLRLIESDPVFEAPYRNLMLCYQRAGELADARATYERLRTTLAARLKSDPSAETQAVLAELKSAGP
jgi:LuxR family transcriptional regulator, maltose regulon positive regulatory protein